MEKHAAGMAGPDWIMVAGYFVIMLGQTCGTRLRTG